MIPILSSLIVGDGKEVSRSRGLVLSATYSAGVILIYTSMGIAAGLAGEGLAAKMQTPWVAGGFAMLMVTLSLSMFDVYQLQMPGWCQTRLLAVSGRQTAGRLLGVFIMGAISALVIGPCVAAPLASVLLYISRTSDVFIGGIALFCLAVGMSVPLLLVGASSGMILPRTGKWMNEVKRLFGVLMLATAWGMVSPYLSAPWTMAGWAVLAFGYAGWLLAKYSSVWVARALALLLVSFGFLQMLGGFGGAADLLIPSAHSVAQSHKVVFQQIKSNADLDAVLASGAGRPVMLDFYADWCTSCKEMERDVFSDVTVQQRLGEMTLLQADVTKNDADDQALMKRFGLFGPPGILFFDDTGREVRSSRVIGYQDAKAFLKAARFQNEAS